ncbi:MAG: hypothetical protein GXP29_10195, partial [Planctomycetes bacterium]|nr:hypothetical protein [Planctomycetota bacterium]
MNDLTPKLSQTIMRKRNSFSAALVASCLVCCAATDRTMASDCNLNSIEDSLDIAAGTSLDCDANGIPDECAGFVVSEDFDTYSANQDPANWSDTAGGSSTVQADDFDVQPIGPDLTFGTFNSGINLHSHYVGTGAADISNMTFTGRMWINDSNGGIGVTFLSQFSDQPSSMYEYLRLRRADYAPSAQPFHLAPPNFDNFTGDIDSGVVPTINTWYRFRIVVDTTGPQLHVQANVWEDGQPEPAGFQIDAFDPSGSHPTSGTIGVWSMGNGGKFWDDLQVVTPDSGGGCDDGDLCTTCDLLSGGVCEGTQVDCSFLDDGCVVGVCNSSNGLCEAVPLPGGAACDDLDNCTSGDVCSDGVCAGTPVDCSFLDDACAVGMCSQSTGACVANPINGGGSCDDLDNCTSVDTCTGGVCAGTPVDCSSLDGECVVGVCNQADGTCETNPVNEGGACSDLSLCTENDVCVGGVCAGTPVDCGTNGVQPEIYWYSSGIINRIAADGTRRQIILNIPSGPGLDVSLAVGKVYWADRAGGQIQRANLDGSDQEVVVTGLGQPRDVVIDTQAGQIYWSDSTLDKIQRANLDGSNVVDIVTNVDFVAGMHLDSANGKLYFSESATDTVNRVNLDGSNLETLLTSVGLGTGADPRGVDIDLTRGHLYYSDLKRNAIFRTNLNGSNEVPFVTGMDAVFDLQILPQTDEIFWFENTSKQLFRSPLLIANPTVIETNASALGMGITPGTGPGDVDCQSAVCNSSNGLCELISVNEAGACDDLDTCTFGDACSNGICAGASVDCSMLDEGCVVGVCNQVDGMCELAPGNEGVACDDLSLCTDNDVCVGGVCAGAPTDCSSLDTPCSFATCDLGTGLCVAPPAPFDCNSNGI